MSCSICMSELNDSITTPCNHTFCNGCLTKWLLTNESCPMCRHTLGENKQHEEEEEEEDDIEIEMRLDSGIRNSFRHTIEEYFEDFVDELFDLDENINDNEYLEEMRVKVSNGIYYMYVEYDEGNKYIYANIIYNPDKRESSITYGMKYKVKWINNEIRKIKMNRKNSRTNMVKIYKCVR